MRTSPKLEALPCPTNRGYQPLPSRFQDSVSDWYVAQLTVLNAVWTRVEDFVDLQLSDPGHGKQHLTLRFPVEGSGETL